MSSTLLDQFVEPVTEDLSAASARKIIEMRADPVLQTRVDELAEKSNLGILSDEEQMEYDRYLAAYHFVTLLQIRARARLI